MNSPVFLELDKSFYVKNNILFSPIFIRRLLEYQSTEFYFDMNYKLNIIDTDVNYFTLTSNQIVQITGSKYKIVDLVGGATQPNSVD